ncbi:Cof-type HAD-IIB family hydrolase [Avibacterium paragallinarum]|uniref:Cof-type HAD-IIB family hydrolase n=1 Tax=Avibacterium paragallinarum TaxID=728 RepID=UPI00021AD50C|nr:Cof-type HAD-IIB family hydrolase [Avibacterium paragallinarum]QIR12431.1 Cof-type HAD-IIB family hydrolase [Avibacterium paragallinarum]QJE10615.1 Cof-type HAD-IIB family hydrolase [Avibacterium paragallinarum]QJE12809.1 Cof-type HAD-IIB family hydrolase [Avibacterium paragallinarum]QJE15010.1 Cof-type HAD-IIB family hydrolase [Avibacterium paragallinarum]QJE17210.1 Cof-type HAD-IIB family hydrolase [Avibacterium paragallinarum]
MSIPNYQQQIKAVFFDIDETLFSKNTNYLPESTQLAIKKLRENNILVGIATGRARCSFPEKINKLIKLENLNTFITMNGQYVEYQNQLIEKHPISTAKIQNLTHFLEKNNIVYAFVSNNKICVSDITSELKEALDPITTNYHVEKDYFKNNEVFQILAFYSNTQDNLIKNAHILDNLKTVRWHPNSVDIFDSEGSKARGIKAIIHHLGLTMENVMAFGDGLNDIEMLNSVGVGVAMGNGHTSLKKVASHITDRIEEDGIYNFLIKSKLIDNK